MSNYLSSNQIAALFAERIALGQYSVGLTVKQVAWLARQYRFEHPGEIISDRFGASGNVGDSPTKFWDLRIFPNGAGFLNIRIVDGPLVYDQYNPNGQMVGQ